MPNLGELLKILHLLFVIVGFAGFIGYDVVMPMAARSKDLALVRAALGFATILDLLALSGFTLAGFLGLGLAAYQDWDFGENTWLNISATLWIVAVLVSLFILRPNLRRLNEMAAEAPGPEVGEQLAAQFKRPLQAIAHNLLTLTFLIILYLMVAKPGVDFAGIEHWPVNS